MSDFDPHSYSVLVKRVLEDGEPIFKATVKELPHVAEFGDSNNEVYDLAIDTINGLHNMAADMGHDFPSPLAEDDDFSGRVTFRMPKSLHRLVANTADVEGVSLNQFLVMAITEKVSTGNVHTLIAEQVNKCLVNSMFSSMVSAVNIDIDWSHPSRQWVVGEPEDTIVDVQETAVTPESAVPIFLLGNRKSLQLSGS
jgi:hypothetical protein